MSADNLVLLPVWKAGDTLTAADRLHELALHAQKRPELYARFAFVRVGTLPNGNLNLDQWSFGCDLPQLVGLFDLGKHLAIEASQP